MSRTWAYVAVAVLVILGPVLVALVEAVADVVVAAAGIAGAVLAAGINHTHELRASRDQAIHEAKQQHYSLIVGKVIDAMHGGAERDLQAALAQAGIFASPPVLEAMETFAAAADASQRGAKFTRLTKVMRDDIHGTRSTALR